MTPQLSSQSLDTAYDTALFDLDGVVYIGSTAVAGAAEAISKARVSGMRAAFVTNNASRTPAAVAELLTRRGVPATPEDVVTSPQAAARLIADRFGRGAAVLVVGDTGLRVGLREWGLRPVTRLTDRPVAVVQGYSPRVSYDVISEAAAAVHAGALFVATNADSTVPASDGPRPGNGSFLRVVAHATGQEPVVAGKPEPPLHDEAILRTEARRPLVIGDRLDTDIEGANRRGADSLLVLTGVTTPADLVLAPEPWRPTYVSEDLSGLNQPHPAPERTDDEVRCGGWVVDSGLRLRGQGDRIDALRALCAAAWMSTTAPERSSVTAALRPLDW
ncbi:HAD-IIA family hydrolase [Spiractinospora alimapuensis]|uniref:HAD-IIA family hydrolase n=1 Tax=Spiractinospora alimapuensis TaxID=2820884 RepID=UPI001F35BD7B|nr:HAD-IIA family hydrolase [Spiractinospora alimapuensis]QVQ52109.1 HAD-IIA family hydrolase [Spiractinospora alimapuensis]